MPKVSIVIPIYNVEQYLRECLDSVLAQSLADIEIICVNDGSTDSCPAILEEYAQKDSRVKVISKANSGYGHTMNTGFDAATGEYIGIVESDDVIPVDMYEKLYDIATANNCDIVKADFSFFIDQDGERIFTPRPLGITLDEPEKYYRRVIKPVDEPIVFRMTMNTWSGIYRTAFIRENNIRHNETPGASFQDNGLFFQTFSLAERAYFLDESMYMLRRDNAASSVHNKNKVWALCVEYDFIYDFLCSRKDIFDKVIGYFWLKRYHNYVWSYDSRIAPEYREEFILRFAEEFNAARERGELDISIFRPGERSRLENILKDPLAYHQEMIRRREEREKAALAAQKKKNGIMNKFHRLWLCIQENGFGYTVKLMLGKLTGANRK